MTELVLKVVALLTFLKIIFLFDINSTSINYIMAEEARILLGQYISNFPKETFLKVILYGHSDLLYTYKDYLNSYGTKINKGFEGDLIIGNDSKLGGIFLDTDNSVAIPIPGGKITEVSISQLSKYFPNGFTILDSKSSEYFFGYGEENSTYNNETICMNCTSGFGFADDMDVNIFQINVFWNKYMISNIKGIDFDLYGYLKEFDFKFYKGQIEIYFYQSFDQKVVNYYLINDKYPHQIYISYTDHKTLKYDGSIMAEHNNSSYFYNFSGFWIPF